MMKTALKKPRKTKLDINREQLRVLNPEQLVFVMGGMTGEDSIHLISSCTSC